MTYVLIGLIILALYCVLIYLSKDNVKVKYWISKIALFSIAFIVLCYIVFTMNQFLNQPEVQSDKETIVKDIIEELKLNHRDSKKVINSLDADSMKSYSVINDKITQSIELTTKQQKQVKEYLQLRKELDADKVTTDEQLFSWFSYFFNLATSLGLLYLLIDNYDGMLKEKNKTGKISKRKKLYLRKTIRLRRLKKIENENLMLREQLNIKTGLVSHYKLQLNEAKRSK